MCEITETTNVDQEIRRFLSIPIDPFEDPLAHMQVFRSERDTLCIRLNHLAGDGAGLKDYAYLLASIYTRLAHEPGYVPIPNLGGSRSLRQVSRRFSFLDKLKYDEL